MHLRGKGMSMEAIYADGRREMLSQVTDFNFNWHNMYIYADDAAPLLPKGTILHFTSWWDNTKTTARIRTRINGSAGAIGPSTKWATPG